MLSKLNKKAQGFTIIEVLIVLAIAGLILLIVFLAVPALQRNSRNTSRRNDVAAVLGAVQEFTNNNGSTLPADATAAQCNTGPTNCNDILLLAKRGIYTANDKVTISTAAAAVANTTVITSGAADINLMIVKNAVCAASGGGATNVGANTRSVVLLFAVEGSGTSDIKQCQAS